MRSPVRRLLGAIAARLERLARAGVSGPDAEVLGRTSLRQWHLMHQEEIVFRSCRWMGVPALTNPLDAWIYQEILREVRPEAIVEIGSHAGGSTLFLAHMLDLLGQGTVISVDRDRSHWVASHPRFRLVTGPSDSPAVVREVTRLCEGLRTMVFHDADHRATQVLRDLLLYAPLVSVGSYLVVEDGIVDFFAAGEALGLPEPGPLPAIREFLRRRPEFAADRSRERYLLTNNPRGFLRRTR